MNELTYGEIVGLEPEAAIGQGYRYEIKVEYRHIFVTLYKRGMFRLWRAVGTELVSLRRLSPLVEKHEIAKAAAGAKQQYLRCKSLSSKYAGVYYP